MPCLLLWRLSFLIGISLCQLSSSACFPLLPTHRLHLCFSSPTSPILYLREETGIRQTANLPSRIGLISLRLPRLFMSSSCSCCHAVSFLINQAAVAHKVKILPYDAVSLQFICRRWFLRVERFAIQVFIFLVLKCKITKVKIMEEERAYCIVMDYKMFCFAALKPWSPRFCVLLVQTADQAHIIMRVVYNGEFDKERHFCIAVKKTNLTSKN